MKIDQGFVADLSQDAASGVIVSAVVEMSHVLGMTVVAEGVETAEQHSEVETIGCESCQGYYFARPMPAEDLETLMQGSTSDGELRLPVSAA